MGPSMYVGDLLDTCIIDLMMGAEMVAETLENFNHLTWLMAKKI